MKTMQVTFLLSLVCFLGCTSTHRLRQADYASINKRAVEKHALVTFVNGRKIQVENLRMTSDSTYWISTNKIATAQVKEVRFRSAGGGRRQWSLDNDTDQTDLYENINKGTRGRNAVLILRDGEELQVRQLWVTSDFTYWIDPQIKQQTSPTYIAVATSQIKEVRFIRRGESALQGMGFGFLLGAVVGYAAGEDCPPNAFICFPREEVAVVFGILGGLIGLPIGGWIGQRYVYIIEHEAAIDTN